MSENLAKDRKPDAAPGRLIKVGDTVVISQAMVDGLHWDTSGGVVTLSNKGNGKDVVLTVSTNPGGPSAPQGDPLTTNSYIRLVSPRHPAPSNELIAYRDGGTFNNVRVGAFNVPHPFIPNIFFLTKVADAPGNSEGPNILRGDVFKIRGVARDPWVTYPAGAGHGTALTLDDNFDSAQSWVFGRFGDDSDCD